MVLWVLDENSMWLPIELQGAIHKIGVNGAGVEVASEIATPAAVLYPWQDRHGTMRYVLLPASSKDVLTINVNGYPLFGLRVLQHQDAISFRYGSKRVRAYFSSEALPRVVSHQPEGDGGGHKKSPLCMRCKGKIDPGHTVVKCPQCGLWYHQMDERNCWTYDQRCAGCQRPTTMEYSWTPEPLHRAMKRSRERLANTHEHA